MKELRQHIQHLKKGVIPKIQDAGQPVRLWSEQDRLAGEIVGSYIVILRTKGCSWARTSGCSMCGYFNESLGKPVSEKDLLLQVDTALQQYNNEPIVKIFTSGSFFDEEEIPLKVQKQIFQMFSKKAKKISVESRPEYVTKENIARMKNICLSPICEIGIGLETANDVVREYAINKGFTYRDYQNAVRLCNKEGCEVKTYVLQKPPFLTEKEALLDSFTTMKKIAHDTQTISLNPANVQRNTLVEFLWRRKQYRPPWLWSIVDVLQKAVKETKGKRIMCDVVGGGSSRGAHNCRQCNRMVLEAIASFSLSQDPSVFDDLDCTCRQSWLDQLELEHMVFGSCNDFMRGW